MRVSRVALHPKAFDGHVSDPSLVHHEDTLRRLHPFSVISVGSLSGCLVVRGQLLKVRPGEPLSGTTEIGWVGEVVPAWHVKRSCLRRDIVALNHLEIDVVKAEEHVIARGQVRVHHGQVVERRVQPRDDPNRGCSQIGVGWVVVPAALVVLPTERNRSNLGKRTDEACLDVFHRHVDENSAFSHVGAEEGNAIPADVRRAVQHRY